MKAGAEQGIYRMRRGKSSFAGRQHRAATEAHRLWGRFVRATAQVSHLLTPCKICTEMVSTLSSKAAEIS
jgi:hypothetical protein